MLKKIVVLSLVLASYTANAEVIINKPNRDSIEFRHYGVPVEYPIIKVGFEEKRHTLKEVKAAVEKVIRKDRFADFFIVVKVKEEKEMKEKRKKAAKMATKIAKELKIKGVTKDRIMIYFDEKPYYDDEVHIIAK